MRRMMVQMRLVEYGVNGWGRRVLMTRRESGFFIMTSVFTFAYDYDLGRRGIFDDVKLLLSSRSPEVAENDEGGNSKGKRSHSESGDISRSWINQYALFEEESSKTTCASSKLVLDRYDDQLMHTRFISSKKVRREVRKQQRIAAGKMYDICMQKMLPGKDVATLWNRKTGKLACSSRHVYGRDCWRIRGHQVFQYQMKVCDGCRGWMKSPEILDNCSTGFHFPPESGEPVQENVLPLKLLHFYRAEE